MSFSFFGPAKVVFAYPQRSGESFKFCGNCKKFFSSFAMEILCSLKNFIRNFSITFQSSCYRSIVKSAAAKPPRRPSPIKQKFNNFCCVSFCFFSAIHRMFGSAFLVRVGELRCWRGAGETQRARLWVGMTIIKKSRKGNGNKVVCENGEEKKVKTLLTARKVRIMGQWIWISYLVFTDSDSYFFDIFFYIQLAWKNIETWVSFLYIFVVAVEFSLWGSEWGGGSWAAVVVGSPPLSHLDSFCSCFLRSEWVSTNRSYWVVVILFISKKEGKALAPFILYFVSAKSFSIQNTVLWGWILVENIALSHYSNSSAFL